MQQWYTIFETDAGACGIGWSAHGITRFQLPAHDARSTERHLLARSGPATSVAALPVELGGVVAAIGRYWTGERVDFSDTALDLRDQDALFLRVYDAVRSIGWGQTTTYGTVARTLGMGPEFARSVGQAMAHNPVPLIIPCHRILAAGNRSGGFSAPGGVETKLRMLHLEGMNTGAPPTPQPEQQTLAFR
jgi:methylated-DNA-[protein]-cysteine S-methyltransferase